MKTVVRINPALCIRCRGEYNLCGLSYCPILAELRTKYTLRQVKGKSEVDGSSPPSVFVGRIGYPRVNVYPATPPMHGDTRGLEDPRTWLSMELEDFLSSRLSLVRGSVKVKVYDAKDPPRLLHDIQIMALSEGPVDSELRFEKPVSGRYVIDEHSPPFGPSSPLKELRLATLPPPPRIIDKVYSDSDLNATDAVWTLYSSGIDVHQISRLLSVGVLGVIRRRRLVPTRWSITAVDKQVSDKLLDHVRDYPLINEYRVYVRKIRDNTFIGILAPHTWLYEWAEAWWPGSTWNLWGGDVVIELDYEGYWGRDDYPSIGGCYYAARIAVLEALSSMRRQAAVILWREIYPGFNLPIGVWWVRENVRAMFKGPYEKFNNIQDALNYVSRFLKIPISTWISRSYVIRRLMKQQGITNWLGR
ncbi:MAG: Nre family DNA repair protein [Vulcanisaeta sp.]